jgi:hypothetical protein
MIMEIHVREIVLEPQKNRGDKAYLFFETGKFSTPLFVLNEYEMKRLILEIEDQIDA